MSFCLWNIEQQSLFFDCGDGCGESKSGLTVQPSATRSHTRDVRVVHICHTAPGPVHLACEVSGPAIVARPPAPTGRTGRVHPAEIGLFKRMFQRLRSRETESRNPISLAVNPRTGARDAHPQWSWCTTRDCRYRRWNAPRRRCWMRHSPPESARKTSSAWCAPPAARLQSRGVRSASAPVLCESGRKQPQERDPPLAPPPVDHPSAGKKNFDVKRLDLNNIRDGSLFSTHTLVPKHGEASFDPQLLVLSGQPPVSAVSVASRCPDGPPVAISYRFLSQTRPPSTSVSAGYLFSIACSRHKTNLRRIHEFR